MKRSIKIERKTRETRVELEMDLDGEGRFEVDIQDAFLTHMVETLARYASFDIKLKATGDIDHHLIEDVAITLGTGLRKLLGQGAIGRLGNATVPMDDALVSVDLDLVDRPFVQIEFDHDPMYEHFLRSFAMEGRLTLHTRVIRGKDAHHLTEATFKALGRALHGATRLVEKDISTKDEVRYGYNGEGE